MADIVPGSQITADPVAMAEALGGADLPADWAGRAVLVQQAEMLHLECIVRGYLAGQAYEEYARAGTVHGTPMPAGLQLASRLAGAHLHPVDQGRGRPRPQHRLGGAVDRVGAEAALAASNLRSPSTAGPQRRCAEAGFVLADTKFEFGYVDGELCLCDEVCTPDSSRLWPADQVVPGQTPPAFDKQPLRDWLAAQPWDRTPPPPPLPDEVTAAMSARYVAAYERVTGRSLADWYGAKA